MPLDANILLQGRTPNLMEALQSGISAGQALRQAPLIEALRKQQLAQAAQRAQQNSLQSYQPQLGTDAQGNSVLLGPVFNRQTGTYELSPLATPEGYNIASDTPEQKAARELALAQGKAQVDVGKQQELNPVLTDRTRSQETAKADVELQTKPNIAKQELLAKDAGKLSTEIFQKMGGIEDNIKNMQEGVRLIDEGAATGPISKWLPSFRETTVKLDNLKNRLGLDVIGSVTFGALSESELKVAFDTAVPQNLRGEALKGWFNDRINAQKKLFSALEDAGIFLSEDGATIPKLMARRRQQRAAVSAPETAPEGGIKFMGFE